MPVNNAIVELFRGACVGDRPTFEAFRRALDADRALYRQTEAEYIRLDSYATTCRPTYARDLAQAHRRRAEKLGIAGVWSADDWLSLCASFGDACLCCGATEVALTPDHVVPMSKGGSNWLTNIQPLCQECNSAKGTRSADYRSNPHPSLPPRPPLSREQLRAYFSLREERVFAIINAENLLRRPRAQQDAQE